MTEFDARKAVSRGCDAIHFKEVTLLEDGFDDVRGASSVDVFSRIVVCEIQHLASGPMTIREWVKGPDDLMRCETGVGYSAQFVIEPLGDGIAGSVHG